MKKKQVAITNLVCLGLSILHLSNTVIYEFWYDYVKQKFGENAQLCYMDIDSFIVYVKINDIYKDIAKDVERRFDTLNCEIDKPLLQGKKWRSNWTNERWIKRTNHERICWIKSKII